MTKYFGVNKYRIYRIWKAMIRRCKSPKDTGYVNYGGRGIEVCERWKIFENFKIDMQQEYDEHIEKFGEMNTQLDRMDNNGNYELNNCRWTTRSQQSVNKRIPKNYLID